MRKKTENLIKKINHTINAGYDLNTPDIRIMLSINRLFENSLDRYGISYLVKLSGKSSRFSIAPFSHSGYFFTRYRATETLNEILDYYKSHGVEVIANEQIAA